MKFKELLEELQRLGMSQIAFNLIYFLVLITFILLAAWMTRRLINRRIKDTSQRYHAKKAVSLAAYVMVAILAVVTFAGRAEYFSVTIGFISAGIAFALQEVILSFAGWISIFSTGVYKPGDRIEINGVKGDVIDISMTKTTLMEIGEWVTSDNYNGRILQISNSFVFKGPVFNYSTDFPFVWDEVILPVKYGSDIGLAHRIIEEVAAGLMNDYAEYAQQHWQKMVRKYLIENANVKPSIYLQLTDNWIEFTLRFVVDYKRRKSNKTQLYQQLLERFNQTDGKVQLVSATIDITAVPPLKVEMSTPET